MMICYQNWFRETNVYTHSHSTLACVRVLDELLVSSTSLSSSDCWMWVKVKTEGEYSVQLIVLSKSVCVWHLCEHKFPLIHSVIHLHPCCCRCFKLSPSFRKIGCGGKTKGRMLHFSVALNGRIVSLQCYIHHTFLTLFILLWTEGSSSQCWETITEFTSTEHIAFGL